MATPRLDGIDTSHWQGISGTQPPLTFALHKASEGGGYKDPTLSKFIAHYRAQPHIQRVGFYHWLRSDSSIESQYTNFVTAVEAVGFRKGDFVMIDWERSSKKVNGVTIPIPDPSVEMVEKFTALLRNRFGSNVVAVYSAPWVTGFSSWRTRNPSVPLVLANYRTSKLLPNNGWTQSRRWNATAWQWTGKGNTPGISGHCDQNMVLDFTWFKNLGSIPPLPSFDPEKGKFGLYPLNKNKDTISRGASGDLVKYAQGVMKKAGHKIAIDGKFGRQTQTHVKWFQGANKLYIDGIVGPQTWAVMDKLAMS